ncbi:unnamed protein product, partial [marine sediment metagenome]
RCLLMSVLLRPERPAQERACLSLAAAVAAAAAIKQVAGVEARTKWPNDLLLDGVKVGGVLLEATSEAVAVGIGINVSGPAVELQARVDRPLTTIEEAAGQVVRREDLLVELLRSLDELYAAFVKNGPAPIVETYRPLDVALGKRVVVEAPEGQITGLAVEIDELGHLVVEDEDGNAHTLMAGEVALTEVEE